MAQIHVLHRFWDRKDRRTRRKGEVFTATEARAQELLRLIPDYVELVDAQPNWADEAPVEETPAEEAVDYSKLETQELKRLCAERGIEVPKRAKKATLVKLLEG